jgi:hypothetical protein
MVDSKTRKRRINSTTARLLESKRSNEKTHTKKQNLYIKIVHIKYAIIP